MPENSSSQTRVVVIGAGLGGLSAAIRLAAAGYAVDVYEKQSGPGGKAFSETHGRYRFDTGPSLFTLRQVFADLFAAAGRRLEDYLELTPLDEICRYFWRDGTRLVSHASPERLAAEFERVLGEPRAHTERYLDYSRRIHSIASELFLERSLHEVPTYGSKTFWSSLARLGGIDAARTMARANASFFDSTHAQQFFNRYATYNGSNPYRTPATLNIIPHVEYGLGAWAVGGGIYALPQALERLASEVGVAFHYGTVIERIELAPPKRPPGVLGALRPARRAVRGVVVDGALVPAEVVVSNADVTATYEHLLGDTDAPIFKRYRRLEPSSSGLVFYWGVRRRFDELGLHNIFFSRDYEGEFREIFDQHRCPSDPTIYINITSKHGAPDDAPGGGENWFILVNAPYDNGQDWEAESQRVRAAVLKRLSDELKTDIEPLIEVESRMLPTDIAARTDSYRGSLYGISSNTPLAAFLRHPNRSRRHPGLYFVGGSAHPGGGMPLVALGGKIVADIVQRRHPRAVAD